MGEIDTAGLEQRCVEPGLWWIEGVQVTRSQQRGPNGHWWFIRWGDRSERVDTLHEARRRIVDAINQGDL